MKSFRPLPQSPFIFFLLFIGLISLISCTSEMNQQRRAALPSIDPLDYVDPFIGTAGKGKTFPGATVPHGMVQLSPDNGRGGWDWISGYFYPDNIIAGFSHTHLSGTGAGDLYDISFMPLTRPFRYQEVEGGPEGGAIVSGFSHSNESASPGYYQVKLDDYNVNVELTAGLRVGHQRYTFEKSSRSAVVRLDLGYSRNWDKTLSSRLELVDEHTLTGYRKSSGWAPDQRVYFYTQFSHPIKQTEIVVDGVKQNGNEHLGTDVAAQFEFDLAESSIVEVRTAISSVSAENAKANFMAENQSPGFDQTRQLAQQKWRDELNKVKVDATPDNMRQFYTAMYHASLAPRIFSDSDGRYKGPDGKIHLASKFKQDGTPRYEFFSLWDTFRALHPWKTIIDTHRSTQMMTSIMDHYQVAGRLPVWNFQGNETDMMMGYHSVPVLVDAYKKGLLREDPLDVFKAAIGSATQNEFGLENYQKLGFVPFEDRPWNVSLTLEYAFDDWAIAELARALDAEKEYLKFSKRAQNYRHHFDAKTGFMRALNSQGQFREPFDENAYHPEDYCEANAWQYSFFVPHDIEGLIEIMGGEQPFVEKLDAMFNAQQTVGEFPEWISGYIGQYVHGNEPSHHVPYLYQFVGQEHKTQSLVRRIMDELYTTEPDGLAGNEDAGQMSAWYLFSALGFYPVNPASGHYVFGSPEVNYAEINLENGKQLIINVLDQSEDNVYVQKISLNNKQLDRIYITHDEIMAGGELTFYMSDIPQE